MDYIMRAIIWIDTPSFWIEKGSIRFKWIKKIFMTSQDDADDKV